MKRIKYLTAVLVLLVLAGTIYLLLFWKGQREQKAWESLQSEETQRLESEKVLSREIALRSIAQAEALIAEKKLVRNSYSLGQLRREKDTTKRSEDQKATQTTEEKHDKKTTRTHYDGFIGKLAAKFTIDWHADGTVSGEYWHPARNPSLKYKLTGDNKTEGVLRLNEYTANAHSAVITLKKNIVEGRIEWSGTMQNINDGRKLNVIMKR